MKIIKVRVLGATYDFDAEAWALDYGMDPNDTKAITEDIKGSMRDALTAHFGDTLGFLIREPS